MSKISVVEPLIVNVSPKTNWTFVTVTTDDDHTGWGEASLNRWEPQLAASVDMLSRDIVDSTVDTAFDAVRYIPHSPGGLVMHAAKSAVEQALTDILAQRARCPVHAVIGGARRDAVPAYANINRGISTRSPGGFAAAARAALAAGYRNIKIAPFDGVIAQDAASTPIDALIRAGLDRVYAVRAAIGGDRALMVDCHWRFDERRAAALIRDLGDASPYWIECPISEHPSQFGAIARLRYLAGERDIKLAGGELVTGADQAMAMCAAGLYDVLMPDIKYAGGYRGMLAIAESLRGPGRRVRAAQSHRADRPSGKHSRLCVGTERAVARAPVGGESVVRPAHRRRCGAADGRGLCRAALARARRPSWTGRLHRVARGYRCRGRPISTSALVSAQVARRKY